MQGSENPLELFEPRGFRDSPQENIAFVETYLGEHYGMGAHGPSGGLLVFRPRLLMPNGIIWVTDGSKIGDKAGAGVYGKTTRTQLSFALGSYASVIQAEIYAILACRMEILKTAPKRRTIQICTDSQAALMAIESSKVKSRLVLDCKKILNDLASCNRVILTWVPGHSGVLGNEEAGRLARVGSIGYPIGPEPILGVPLFNGGSNHERAPK
ncbi:hypothetical protein NQ318_001645 [Aromia moschata]|uniref:RNase H type-1 domain-containing protein n=1 Tax=Aromia moschata TaxID=1265417 RepID=A0AAV8Y229_9CUCU|nr:hypothetical protein NQ318_001645 [Aromia moschata]